MADTVVVTGGAGFIGSHLAERLLKAGHRVRVLDNLLTGKQANLDMLAGLGGDYTYYAADITDQESLRPAFSGADLVFHHAALPSVHGSVADPMATHHNCVTGTLTVLLAARDAGVRRVVYAASSAAYGDDPTEYKTEDLLPQPTSPYGVAKLVGEYYCQVFTRVYGLETACLRYFNVFGPRQDPASEYAAVIPKFITRMLQGQAPIIYGDGQQSRDFTYIDNVVHGTLLASHAPDATGELMNLATAESVSLLELVNRLNAVMGTDFAPIHEPARPGDIMHSLAGIERARQLLDFVPVVSFEEGLSRTVDFYRRQM